MTLKNRLRKYLQKRNAPVNHEQLVQVAQKAGIPKREINNVLYELQEPDIGVWFGHPFATYNQRGQQKRWYCYYPITQSQRDKYHDDMAWFESI